MTRRALREAARAKAEAAASRANEVEPVASSPVEDASDTTPEVAPVESAPRAEAAEPLTEDEFAAATEAFRVAGRPRPHPPPALVRGSGVSGFPRPRA